MDIKITEELQEYIKEDLRLFQALKGNAVAMNKYVQKEYAYLIGKKVKFINKGWNTGVITAIYPKAVRQKEGSFYMNVDVKGPSKQGLLFGLEEVELIED